MSDSKKSSSFIEVGHYQLFKNGENAGGDTFLSQKNDADGRVITVLSDGLGSGIKAGVLSTLTATMAVKFIASDIPIQRATEIIMSTLPICKDRGISYATFTLVDIEPNSTVQVMEYDNPPYLLFREGRVEEPDKESSLVDSQRAEGLIAREMKVQYSSYQARPEDYLIFYSDGVTQSGMGTKVFPLGWGNAKAREFIQDLVREHKGISARDLAKKIVQKAHQNDCYESKDDITCGVIYFRQPRDLLIMTGPPVNHERDVEMLREFTGFEGKKIIAGGTTSNIISRETGKKVKPILKNIDPEIPPISEMEGADLVTEGIITLARVEQILEAGAKLGEAASIERERQNGARRIAEMLLDSDRVRFVVGTRINEAHQDPNIPVELELRRSVVKRIQKLLVEHYLKEVTIKYV